MECSELFRVINTVLMYPRLMREEAIEAMKNQDLDVLVIGLGATGAGIVRDARSRGLNVAGIDRNDMACETSSRSTKLVHGGVRYLENAVKHLDPSQLELVREALKERGIFLKNAPHLSHPLPIFTPVYSWFDALYYLIGLKSYDLLAQGNDMPGTKFVSRRKLMKIFPMLSDKKLRGGLLYFDGQFDDARMNVSVAKSAAEEGAHVANHVQTIGLVKQNGRVVGAELEDMLTGEKWTQRAKVVINATGPFTDKIRAMDEEKPVPMVEASSGTHIILDESFLPPDQGILIPKTKDGRVLFVLPWNGKVIVGTTDNEAKVVENPKPSEEDINFILETIHPLYKNPPTRKDVLAAWTGLRPLALTENSSGKGTAGISRDHEIRVSKSALISIAGGKWTTYRKMAEDAVNRAVEVGQLKPQIKMSQTEHMPVVGAHGFSETMPDELSKEFGFDASTAHYLAHAYGDRAYDVGRIAKKGYAEKLNPKYPYIKAEVIYAAVSESARSVVDVVARRMRMSFLDHEATFKVIPVVADIMGDTLGWSTEKKQKEIESALAYFK